MFKKVIIASAMAIMLVGCSGGVATPVPVTEQKSMFIVMKLPSIKYADQGFVGNDGESTKVEIYSNGVPVMKIDIKGSKVCSGSGLFSCMSKSSFNSKFLTSSYPDDTFEQILLGQPIFDSEGLEGGGDSFTQNISKAGEYDISYSVGSGSTEFRDSQNNILIKIRNN